MADNTAKPVVFLATANSYEDGRRLKYLVRERRTIAKKLLSTGTCEVLQEGNTSIDYFFDEMRSPLYKDRIAIIHFAGHADGATLRFESEEGNVQEMDTDALADFLHTIKGIHLIFLNGCGTKPIVEGMLEAGIPAIIATERPIQDANAAKVAEEFYDGLAAGYTIEESFLQAKAIAKALDGTDFEKFEVRSTGGSRSLHWEGKADVAEGATFPWGLYVRKGQEQHLEWRLESSTAASDPTAATNTRTGFLHKMGIGLNLKTALLGIGIIAVLVLGFLWGSGAFDKPKVETNLSDIFKDESKVKNLQNTLSGDDHTYTCLLLPTIPIPGSDSIDLKPTIKAAIESFTYDENLELKIISEQSLLERNKLGRLGIKGLHTVKNHLVANTANLMADVLGVDLIIWGNYNYIEEGSTRNIEELTLEYAFGSQTRFGEETLFGGGSNFSDKIKNVVNTELKAEIQKKRVFDVFNFATAEKLLSTGLLEAATKFLEDIRSDNGNVNVKRFLVKSRHLGIGIGPKIKEKKVDELLAEISRHQLNPLAKPATYNQEKVKEEEFWLLLALLYQYHGKPIEPKVENRWSIVNKSFEYADQPGTSKDIAFHFHRGRLNLYGLDNESASQALQEIKDSLNIPLAEEDLKKVVGLLTQNASLEPYEVAFHDLGLLYRHKLSNRKEAKRYFRELISRQKDYVGNRNTDVFWDYAELLRAEKYPIDSVMHQYMQILRYRKKITPYHKWVFQKWTANLHRKGDSKTVLIILDSLKKYQGEADYYRQFLPDTLIPEYFPEDTSP